MSWYYRNSTGVCRFRLSKAPEQQGPFTICNVEGMKVGTGFSPYVNLQE
jgi:hypothetical protein